MSSCQNNGQSSDATKKDLTEKKNWWTSLSKSFLVFGEIEEEVKAATAASRELHASRQDIKSFTKTAVNRCIKSANPVNCPKVVFVEKLQLLA